MAASNDGLRKLKARRKRILHLNSILLLSLRKTVVVDNLRWMTKKIKTHIECLISSLLLFCFSAMFGEDNNDDGVLFGDWNDSEEEVKKKKKKLVRLRTTLQNAVRNMNVHIIYLVMIEIACYDVVTAHVCYYVFFSSSAALTRHVLF